jgi:hypothetical protein
MASDVCSTRLQPRESSSEQNANLYNTNPDFLDGLKKTLVHKFCGYIALIFKKH